MAALPTQQAMAQTDGSILVEPIRPPEFDRGRNVGVAERARPEYDQLGMRTGGFLVFPSLDTSIGVTNNVFLTGTNRQSDGFISLRPRVEARSDWNDSDQVRLSAQADVHRYFSESLRNQDGFDLRALGTKRMTETLSVTGEAQFAQRYESPENGATSAATAVISHYRQFFGAARAQMTTARWRYTLSFDHVGLDFAPLKGTPISQRDRDRVINRGTLEVQYAHTPSVAFYAQATYGGIDYTLPLLADGKPNRDSTGLRLIGGVNFDIPGSMRGRVGAGYVSRSYKAATYRDVSGLAAEAQLEFFPSRLTTLRAGAARVVEDSSLSSAGTYFDNRFSVGVDHELLYNMIVTGRAEYRLQDYKNTPRKANYYAGSAGLRYLASQFLSLNANASFGKRDVNDGDRYDELRFVMGIRIQR